MPLRFAGPDASVPDEKGFAAGDQSTYRGKMMRHRRTADGKRTVWGCFFLLVIPALLFFPSFCGAIDTTARERSRLTPQEQAYVRDHKKVTLCVDPDWVPFERLDATGRHVGIAADLLELVSARTGVEFELVPTKNWNESLAFSKSGRCTVLSFLNQTVDRSEWLIFTAPKEPEKTGWSAASAGQCPFLWKKAHCLPPVKNSHAMPTQAWFPFVSSPGFYKFIARLPAI